MTETDTGKTKSGFFGLIDDALTTFFGQGKGFQMILSGVIGAIASILIYVVFAETTIALIGGMLVTGFVFGFLDRSKDNDKAT